jgi:hypothetical protein
MILFGRHCHRLLRTAIHNLLVDNVFVLKRVGGLISGDIKGGMVFNMDSLFIFYDINVIFF